MSTPNLGVDRKTVSAEELEALGVDLHGDFPGSTVADFRRYPVLSEGGWQISVKPQPSLRSVGRIPWTLLGPVQLLSAGSDLK